MLKDNEFVSPRRPGPGSVVAGGFCYIFVDVSGLPRSRSLDQEQSALHLSGAHRRHCHAPRRRRRRQVSGRWAPVWVALPHPAWVEYKKRTGTMITDPLAVEIAGHFLKTALESGEGVGREMYSLTVEETLKHLEAVVNRSRRNRQLPRTCRRASSPVLHERAARAFILQPADQQFPLVDHLRR